MQINLFRFNKRANSTAIMNGTGYPFEVVLKDNTSMIRPEFVLNWNNSNPTLYNYCYCSAFSRYYFIRDWVFDGRMWIAVCESDVMGSFRTPIFNSHLYVLRSASEYDTKIIDTKYPAKGESKRIYSGGVDLGFNSPDEPNNGYYILGVMTRASGVVAPTGITYYVLKAFDLNQIINGLYPDLTTSLTSLDTILDVPAIMISNPSQFIASLLWLPFAPDTTTSNNCVLGFFEVATGSIGIATKLCKTFNFNITPPRPSSSRGDWQMLEPFCKYYLYVPYFGNIEIPSTICAYHDLSVSITVSIATGRAQLKVRAVDFTTSPIKPIIVRSAQIGQPMQLAGVADNWNGIATGIGSVASGVGNMLMGNDIEGALQFTTGSIQTAFASCTKVGESTGCAGGSTETDPYAGMWCEYYEPTEDDNVNFGKPLCKRKLIKDLSGFCQVLDGKDVDCFATPEEKEKIAQYLEGGFYIG